KVLAPAASADWRARDRGINSGAVYAAKALARNEAEVKLPVGLIKTKKILSGCAGNGLRLGAGHVVSVLGAFFHGSCARAHPWWGGNDCCAWKFPARSKERGALGPASVWSPALFSHTMT